MQIIQKYFPELSSKQVQQFIELERLYLYWNAKINVISRKSIDRIYTNHILHSLSIAKVVEFEKGTKILDVGTGGGFPGIPLAILFPAAEFLLVDSIGKKIRVVKEISSSIGLKNICAMHQRVENIEDSFDFIVSRAVAKMADFQNLVHGKLSDNHKNSLSNGILYLKGGDLSVELQGVLHQQYKISDFFEENYFKTKKIVYISY